MIYYISYTPNLRSNSCGLPPTNPVPISSYGPKLELQVCACARTGNILFFSSLILHCHSMTDRRIIEHAQRFVRTHVQYLRHAQGEFCHLTSVLWVVVSVFVQKKYNRYPSIHHLFGRAPYWTSFGRWVPWRSEKKLSYTVRRTVLDCSVPLVVSVSVFIKFFSSLPIAKQYTYVWFWRTQTRRQAI